MNGCVRAKAMWNRLLSELTVACPLWAYRRRAKQCTFIQLMEESRVHHYSIVAIFPDRRRIACQILFSISSFKQAFCAYEIITVLCLYLMRIKSCFCCSSKFNLRHFLLSSAASRFFFTIRSHSNGVFGRKKRIFLNAPFMGRLKRRRGPDASVRAANTCR